MVNLASLSLTLDQNGDGTLNILDVIQSLNIALGNTPPRGGWCKNSLASLQPTPTDITAAPGQRRYFKCTPHASAANFQIYCPPLVNQYSIDYFDSPFAPAPPSPPTFEVSFPYSPAQQVELCEGQNVRITWEGYHNLIETASADCSSATVQTIESGFFDTGHTQVYTTLGAQKGTTRYFKCTPHCQGGARLEFSCPG